MHLGKIGASVTGIFVVWWVTGSFCHDTLHMSNDKTFAIATGLTAFLSASFAALYFGGKAGDREDSKKDS
jgi:hypothetical protein